MNIVQLIIPFILLGISVLGGAFAVFPKYEELINAQGAIQETELRVQRGEEVLARLRSLKREVQGRQEEFVKIEEAVPGEVALPKVYHDLQRIGAESGLVLESAGSTEGELGERGGQVKKAIVTLKFQGSYEGIKEFLLQAKSSTRMFNTQIVQIQGGNEAAEILQLQVDINVYAWK